MKTIFNGNNILLKWYFTDAITGTDFSFDNADTKVVLYSHNYKKELNHSIEGNIIQLTIPSHLPIGIYSLECTYWVGIGAKRANVVIHEAFQVTRNTGALIEPELEFYSVAMPIFTTKIATVEYITEKRYKELETSQSLGKRTLYVVTTESGVETMYLYNKPLGEGGYPADEEDITLAEKVEEVENEYGDVVEKTTKVYKFKDRDTTKGKGYIILRTEKSIFEQMTQENTIYEIRYDFDLGGETLEVPANCVLDFKGGSFKNGIVYFNNCLIKGEYEIFKDISFGSRPNGYVNVLWFGAKGDRKTDNTEIFREAFSKGMPVFIPNGQNYYIIKNTITVKNHIKCEGKILFTPDVETNIPAFLVEGGDFHDVSTSILVVDGLDVTQHETYFTATGIKIERLDTKLINSWFYALKYGIDINSYSIKVHNCTVRSCNVNLVVRALNEMNQCNDIAITNCTLGQAQWLAVDIGGQKPSSLVGWNGWNILLQGCSFDEASVRVDHSYNVTIRDCYFERASATNIGIIINESQAQYTSHNVNIDNCSFINFQYAIDCRTYCDYLSVTNCTFKSIKRCAILCTLGTYNQRITITNNKFNDSVKNFHYGVSLWTGDYNKFNFNGLTFDGWYMVNGCQNVPEHGKCNFITKTYKSYKVLDNDFILTGEVSSAEPFGNTYTNPAKNVQANYIKGSNEISNVLTITNDSDYYKFNIWDQILVYDSSGTAHRMLITDTLSIKNNNSFVVTDISYPLMTTLNGCTVSQVSAIFDIDWRAKAVPVSNALSTGTIVRKINSNDFYKYNGSSWDLYNADGTLDRNVKVIHKGLTNDAVLNTAYRHNICVIDEIDLNGKTLTLLDYGTLEFKQGGKFVNGTVNLHNTKLLPIGCNPTDYMSSTPTGSYRTGQVIYDTSLGKQKLWNGNTWVNVDGSDLS